jgi:hypothetical protein
MSEWKSPTGHSDPDNVWTGEAYGYCFAEHLSVTPAFAKGSIP